MPPPKVTFVNSSEVNIEWASEEFDHGGPIIKYQIKLTSQTLQRSQVIDYKVKNGFNNQMNTRIDLDRKADGMDWLPNCENQSSNTNLYNFSIRAVTEDKQMGKIYSSPWSLEEVQPAPCYSKFENRPLYVVLELMFIL